MTMHTYNVDLDLSAEDIAHAFWHLNANEQADFFAELHRIADYRLCFQMANVIYTIEERSGNGDHEAQNGFQTMLSHAQAYVESVTDIRGSRAMLELDRLRDSAKERLGLLP